MSLYKNATGCLCLATSLLAGALLAGNALADDAAKTSKDPGLHTEIRDGANETPATNKGTGTGILGTGPVKQRAEDQKAGKSEKMYDSQYETDRTKKKGDGANQ